MLITQKIHRLPIIDSVSGNVLNIITHKRILLFLYQNVRSCSLTHAPITHSIQLFSQNPPSIIHMRLGDLQIGTKRNVHKVCGMLPYSLHPVQASVQISPETKVIEALRLFSEFRVSALPIVDENGMHRYSTHCSFINQHAQTLC